MASDKKTLDVFACADNPERENSVLSDAESKNSADGDCAVEQEKTADISKTPDLQNHAESRDFSMPCGENDITNGNNSDDGKSISADDYVDNGNNSDNENGITNGNNADESRTSDGNNGDNGGNGDNADEDDEDDSETPPKRRFDKELLSIIRGGFPDDKIKELLSDYHDNDIASVIPLLTSDERKKLYRILGVDAVSDVFSYLDDASQYLAEFSNEKAADIIESMDADDALDVLDDLSESKKQEIIGLMDKEKADDVNLIAKYADDELGSLMTTNYIAVNKNESVKGAMRKIIDLAADNDNISTIYVTEGSENKFYGAIDLRDLVIARSYQDLGDIIVTSYPYIYASEKISDSLETIKEYSEDSLPVLDEENKLIGVITASDVVEAVDDEMGEDYAKLAGLTEEDDLTEPIKKSIAKRIPWLIVLLLLDIAIGAYIGLFEAVVVGLPFLVCYQSLILGMSGNVGTQSLAITVRVLSDENVKRKEKLKLMLKEVRVGFFNGLILGVLSAIVITLYMYLTNAAGNGSFVTALLSGTAVGCALLLSMTVSSFTGTAVPILLEKCKVDPAVASGPMITTINDLVAVTVYYGFAMLLILELSI